jgi:hypothetical protein
MKKNRKADPNRGDQTTLVRGDKVKTCYGQIETVTSADEAQVYTSESVRQLCWYHPTKVWKVEEAK